MISVPCAHPGCPAVGRTVVVADKDYSASSGILTPPGWTYTSGPDADPEGGMKSYPLTRHWCPVHRGPADAWDAAVAAARMSGVPAPLAPWAPAETR